MIYSALPIEGAFKIDLEPLVDARGFFSRSFCQNENEGLNLDFCIAQQSISFNPKKYTLRGLHYRNSSPREDKIVRVTAGKIFDVILDLRPGSKSYLSWCGIELCSKNRSSVFIPHGVAHGFLTLETDTEVFYQMNSVFSEFGQSGVRWDDQSFKIQWPGEPRIISERDMNYPDYVSLNGLSE